MVVVVGGVVVRLVVGVVVVCVVVGVLVVVVVVFVVAAVVVGSRGNAWSPKETHLAMTVFYFQNGIERQTETERKEKEKKKKPGK